MYGKIAKLVIQQYLNIQKMLQHIIQTVQEYGVNTTDETNYTWLLLNWQVKVIKRPIYGQTLDIHTWSRKIIKCYAYRDFEIYDNEGNLCVIATSKWLLINSNERKIAKVEPELADRYKSEIDKFVFDNPEIEKLKVPADFKNEMTYKVQRRDIDVIGHMHNLYYLDLAYETLPDAVYSKRPFDNIRVMYKKEIKFGETVRCKYSQENNKNIVVIESVDGKILHAIIKIW